MEVVNKTVQKRPVVKTIESAYAKRIKNVAAYARVSTLKDEQEDSYESQMEYYSAYIKSNPQWNFVGMYADKGISGTQAKKRPDFMRMIEDAKAGKIDLIIVKSISRFARNTVDATTYVHELKSIGVEVRFEKEELSSFNASSDMIFNLLAAMAQEESRSISENIKWALKKKAEVGVRRIGSNRVLGYSEEGDILVPNEDAWIAKYIFSRYAAGAEIKEIIAGLKAQGAITMRGNDTFSERTIYSMLKNELYVGDRLIQKSAPQNYLTKQPDYTVDYESYFIEDDHEAIVDRETWNTVQERLKNKKCGRVSYSDHFLYGKVVCHECGRTYFRLKAGKHFYWKCSGAGRKGCRAKKYIPEKKLIEEVICNLGPDVTEEAVKEKIKTIQIDADRTITIIKK